MTEDRSPKASDDPAAAAGAAKQRKKRKWDQPAEHFVSAAAAVPGLLSGLGGVVGISHQVAVPLPVTDAGSAQLLQSVSISHNAAEIIQKLTQPKIQDELIAREIVINDADPTVRYKLTKRQTQEEIQKCTGAVVITRGKYRPPNSLPDGEKPLYLHISAGAHLKDMAERIRAVDCAASMVEEILKQVQNSPSSSIPINLVQSNGQVSLPLTTYLFLGFEADPSLNIAARIRGPNIVFCVVGGFHLYIQDQYVNHIIKETGVHVELRGQGSGNLQNGHSEVQQPLHLYLSSTNAKSLEAARILAENLFDTIAAECGASRMPSSKVYNAVPPPQQLLAGVHGLAVVPPSPVSIAPSPSQCFAPTGVSVSTGCSMPSNVIQPNIVSYAPPSLTGGTCYTGYGGIYPQATPLQQVALALKQAPASTAPAVLSTSLSASAITKTSASTSAGLDKRPPQKRKFQELLLSAKGRTAPSQNSRQGSEFLKPGSKDSGVRSVSSMPPPRKLAEPASCVMPPPPPMNMPPPLPPRNMSPPPPKFFAPQSAPKIESSSLGLNDSMRPPLSTRTSVTKSSSVQSPPKNPVTANTNGGSVSDTLLKLMEYGDEDDDADDTEELLKSSPVQKSVPKPFWAV